ncbi:MAG: hypothetical protein QOI19_856 [Thermoleophilaceae bacterium]|nr:hypothetical protein [Thermoleophilaceae bacterium]
MLRPGRLLAIAAFLLFAAPVSAAQAALTASAKPAEIKYGQSTAISGKATNGMPVQLDEKASGASTYTPVNMMTADAGDGSYSFSDLRPGFNTSYRVTSGPEQVTRLVIVDEVLTIPKPKPLGGGRMRITLASRHPSDLKWGKRRAYVFVAQGSSRYTLVAKPRTSQSGETTRLSADVPVAKAGKFQFFACFSAPNDGALGASDQHVGCHHHSFVRKSHKRRHKSITAFEGSGTAPAGYPSAARIAAAAHYQGSRSGFTAFAVVDSEGRLSGRHIHRTFVTASVIKAMLLVAYLRKLDAAHKGLDSSSRSILHPMIHVSDNHAATVIWGRVGNTRLYRLAHLAGMTDFSISGIWASAHFSAADQAKFFYKQDSLIPRKFRGYARSLLSHISGAQSWGIPHVARPDGWHVFFKGGWRGTGRGQLVHQASRLEKGHTKFSLAVMTDGDPSMGYGITTIQGVTARLLSRPAPKPVYAKTLGPGGG